MKLKYSVTVACFLPGQAKDLSAPLYLISCDGLFCKSRLDT